MIVRLICQEEWRLVAICNSAHETFLDELALTAKAEAGLLAALNRLAMLGPDSFNSELLHWVHKDPKIFQLSKGKIRALWFYADDSTMVLCNAFVKKTQKTPPGVIESALRFFDAYQDAKTAGSVTLIRDEED